jgi:hypothetical protein
MAVLNGYLEDYHPEGQTENDLVEAIAAAKWQQLRCATLIRALVDITMDRMEQEIAGEFRMIDNATRTVLAFLKESHQSAGLALLNRYAARHDREWHRAIDKLRIIQNEKRKRSVAPDSPLVTRHSSLETPNEPEPPAIADAQLATSHQPLATEVLPNEPEPTQTPEPSTTSEPQLATEVSDPQLATGHWPLATDPATEKDLPI